MRNLLDLVEIGDLIDILLVTTLVYTAVVWIRRTQAAFVAVGLFVLAGVYVLAEALDLRLTTAIFRGFFAISLVMIVVLFQEELRQLFERLGVWSVRRGRRRLAARSMPADILVETLTDLARQHVGALIVLPGRQPVTRHVRGGLVLDGVVSVPLLKSVFDPHSPGHDGAAIVEGDRVTRFAAHLPLSTNFVALAGVGTRHSAALGLAEVTDALCLVVSEERGQISVARDGKLRRLEDPVELTAEIDRFLHDTRPSDGERRSFLRQLVREHWVEKVASLIFVSALWYAVVPGSRPVKRTFPVEVHVSNLPPNLVLDDVKPAQITVTLSGLRREFLLFNPRLLRVNLDARLATAGRRTFQVADRDVRYPKSLALEAIQPDSVRISVRPAAPPPAEPAPGELPSPSTSPVS
jgi:diadenylate cyclase